MNAHAFRIGFTHEISMDEFKSMFSHLGTVADVSSQEVTCGYSSGYSYTIHMENWTKPGEAFRNRLLEDGTFRYCYDDTGRHPCFFICEPVI